MFSNLILRNSRRSRKENGLFFSSLVISIVAFYMILSISTQDVMLFLQKMESDAVDKLLLLIPAFYGMTLGILFFLIYFACKYQFERRRHEFGVYLMLGMRRSKLFGMLLAEDFLTSILAMLIGLPVAARVGLVQQRAGTHTNPDAPKRHRAAFRPGFHPGREQHRVYNLYDYRHRGLLHHSNGGKLDSVGWRYVCL